jgi:FlgD Ig-like domain/Uncharacterised protein family (UPF0164)
MKTIQMLTLALLAILSAAPGLLAIQGDAGSPGAFLEYGAGARSIALGKAMTGLANDVSATYFNPAGLVQMNPQMLTLMHTALVEKSYYDYLGYSYPTRAAGTFGTAFVAVTSQGIEDRTAQNQLIGRFDDAQYAWIVSWGKDLNRWSAVGLNYKAIYHKIAYWGGLGHGADLGLFLFRQKPVTVGLCYQNVLRPTIQLARGKDVYPSTWRAGTAVHVLRDRLIASGDVAWTQHQNLKGMGGVEFRAFKGLALRGGIDPIQVNGGAGIAVSRVNWGLTLDYAVAVHYQSQGQFPPLHNASLSFTFGGFHTGVRARPGVFSPMASAEDNLVRIEIKAATRRKPAKWQLLVKNSLGEVVRTYGTWGPPPKEVTWDGRDEAGLLVPDGHYSYDLLIVQEGGEPYTDDGYLTQVKTVGPKAAIQIEEGQHEEQPVKKEKGKSKEEQGKKKP